MPRGIYAVFTHCTEPAREEEFNRWYTHTHLPDLSKAKGFVGAKRYRNLDPASETAKFVAVYEFESDDLKESVKDLLRHAMQAFADGRHIDCIAGAGSLPAFLLEEIEPASLRPLEKLDYPTAVPEEIRRGVEEFLAS